MTPLETVRAYYGLFEKPSREVLDAVVTDDFVLDDNPIDWHIRGKAELWRTVDRPRPEGGSGAAQGSFVVTGYVGDDARGAAAWHWRVAGSMAPMFGLPRSEGGAEIDGLALVEFRGGRLAKLTEFWDSGSVMRQLGADLPQARFPAPAQA
jgi:steroid delta-isomerase-like uncharacterized protein